MLLDTMMLERSYCETQGTEDPSLVSISLKKSLRDCVIDATEKRSVDPYELDK